jgi:cytochrome P450
MLPSVRALPRVARLAEKHPGIAVIYLRQRSTEAADSTLPSAVLTQSTPAYTSSPPKEFSEIPGPRQWPLLGSYPTLHGHVHEMHLLFGQLVDRYGPLFQLKLPWKAPVIVTSDTAAIEQLFQVEGKFPRRTYNSPLDWALEKTNLPTGILFSRGEHWRRLRSAMNKQITLSNIYQLLPVLNSVYDDFPKLVENTKENGQVNDIFPLLITCVINGVSSIIFGTRMSTTGGELSKESQKIVDTTVDIVQTLSAIIYSPPWYKLFPTPALKRFDVKLRELHHLAKTLKERRMKEIQEASKNGKQEKDAGFLSQWIANEEMQEDDIQPLVNDMLLAGSDTTSITSMFLLHEIAKNPKVQDKLFAELCGALENGEDLDTNNIQKLSYAKNCMKETLRMYPVGNVVRNLPEEAVLLGYKIPKHTSVIVPIYTMGRNPYYFDEPDVFDPDRWDRSRKQNRFAYLPFGHGPRTCYGRRLAELKILTLLAKVCNYIRILLNVM